MGDLAGLVQGEDIARHHMLIYRTVTIKCNYINNFYLIL